MAHPSLLSRINCSSCAISSSDSFFRLVKAAFAQRRKTLQNALGNALPDCRAALPSALERVDIDPRARGETLSCEDFARLADALGESLTET